MSIAATMAICYKAKGPRLTISGGVGAEAPQGIKKAVLLTPEGDEDHGLLFEAVRGPGMFSWTRQSGML